ncbi:WD40-repeat-containing domain protein [Chytriomyces sp. MP71]|nr:WD40-repeat-containing domain protein [Chytriomyces sp. MP71]
MQSGRTKRGSSTSQGVHKNDVKKEERNNGIIFRIDEVNKGKCQQEVQSQQKEPNLESILYNNTSESPADAKRRRVEMRAWFQKQNVRGYRKRLLQDNSQRLSNRNESVLPWSVVRRLLIKKLKLSGELDVCPHKARRPGSGASTVSSNSDSTQSAGVFPNATGSTIPFGFQLTRNIHSFPNSNTSIKTVLHIPHSCAQAIHSLKTQEAKHSNKSRSQNLSSIKGKGVATSEDDEDSDGSEPDGAADSGRDVLLTVDTNCAHIWRGAEVVMKVDISNKLPLSKRTEQSQAGGVGSGASGMERILFIEKYRVFFIFSNQLQLRVLDMHLNVLAKAACAAPVLWMEFIEPHSQLVTGETGSIRIWDVKRSTKHHVVHFEIIEKAFISDPYFDFDNWVVFVMWERIQNRIIALCDTNIYFFDTMNLSLLDSIKNTHKFSVTYCVFYEPLEYLVTAAKDGTIKVWNNQNCVIHEFDQHIAAVTGLQLYIRPDQAVKYPPLVLSSSLDGTVRMWNIDLGVCVYRLDTLMPLLGLSITQKDAILVYGKKNMQIWSLNQNYQVFKFSRSRPILLSRHSRPHHRAPRILSAYIDGSIKLLSPFSGELLIVGYPIFKDAATIELEYDTFHEKIYARISSGDIVVYSARSNPMKVLDVLETTSHHESINCICGIHFNKDAFPEHFNTESEERKNTIISTGCIFYLVAGTTDGQIVNILTNSTGKIKYETVVQAHSGEVIALQYDHVNFLLVSGGSDDVVKVWKISSRNLTASKNSIESTCPLYLDCTAVLTFCNSIDQGILQENSLLLHKMRIDPFSKTIAVPWNGKPRILSYSEEAKIFPKSFQTKKPASIAAITFCPQYNIWATADSLGSAKVWDADGTLIREIQFGEEISCVLFLNLRGDLLVGQQDQISVVCVQDYFTFPLMKEAIERSARPFDSRNIELGNANSALKPQQIYDDDLDSDVVHDANGFHDDPEEQAPIFDSNTDFWGIFYEGQKAQYGSVHWHIPKGLEATRLNVKMENQIETWTRELDATAALKRKNRRIFLGKEIEVYQASNNFEEKYTASKFNAAHNKGKFVPSVDKAREEPIDSENNDLIFLRRADSDILEVPTGALGPTPRIEMMPNSNWKTVKENFIIGSKLGRVIQAVVHEKKAQLERIERTIIQNPNRKKLTGKNAIMERDKMKASLKRAGIALPNSVSYVDGNISVIDKPSPSSPVPVTQPVSLDHANIKKKTIIERKKSARPSWWYQPDDDDDTEFSGQKDRKTSISKNVKYVKIKPSEELGRPSKFEEIDENEENNQSIELPIIQVTGEEDLLTVSRKLPVRSRSTSIAGQPKDEPSNIKPTFIEVMQMALARSKLDLNDGLSKSRQKPKDVQTARPKTSSSRKAVSRQLESKVIINVPNPAPTIIPEVPANPSKKIKTSPYYPPKPKLKAPAPLVHDDMIPKPVTHVYMPSARFDSEISSEVSDDIVEDMNGVSEAEAAAYAWNLLRMRHGTGIPAALKKILEQFWFKNLEEDPADLVQVIESLIGLMRAGNWSECCEASKALLFIYMTFCKDIPDPHHIFIVPHLEVLDTNEHWQARAQICSNLSAFKMPLPNVYHSLVIRLNDSHIVVRMAAKRALMYFGIDSRAELLEVMKRLGFFGDKAGRQKLSRLQVLEKKLLKRDIAVAAERMECVKMWQSTLSEIPIPTNSHARHVRRHSYLEHLAGPFFKPDGPDDPYTTDWTSIYRHPEAQFVHYHVPENADQWATQSFDDELRSWTDRSQTETRFTQGKHSALQALVQGRPTSAVHGKTRPQTASLKAAMSMMRPLSAGIKAEVALEFRKTNKRPKSAFITSSLPKVVQDDISREKIRPRTAAAKLQDSCRPDFTPYEKSEAFFQHQPKKRAPLSLDRRAWR